MLDIPTPRKRLIATAVDRVGRWVHRAATFIKPPPAAPDPRGAEFKRILVLRPDHIGDVIMATPIFRALRDRYPGAKLTCLTGSWAADILKYHPCVDETIVYDAPWWAGIRQSSKGSKLARFRAGYGPILDRIRHDEFDLVLDPRGDFRHILFLMYWPGIPCRIGYGRTGGEYLLTHACPWDPGLHNIDKNLAILAPLGITNASRATEVHAGPEATERVAARLHDAGLSNEPLLVLHPGARTMVKKWAPDRFARVANELAHRHSLHVILVGGKEEKDLGQTVASGMSRPPFAWAGELSLLELVALCRRATLFLSNDSGPMHLAAAAGSPILSVFGATDPTIYGYRGPRQDYIYLAKECSPCHFENACPYATGPESKCMEELPVDLVIQRAEELLARPVP